MNGAERGTVGVIDGAGWRHAADSRVRSWEPRSSYIQKKGRQIMAPSKRQSYGSVLIVVGLITCGGMALAQEKRSVSGGHFQLEIEGSPAGLVPKQGDLQLAPPVLLKPVPVPALTNAEKIALIRKTSYSGKLTPESFGPPVVLSIVQPRATRAMLSAQNVSFDLSDSGGVIPMPSFWRVAPEGRVPRRPSVSVKLKSARVDKSFLIDFSVGAMANRDTGKTNVELQTHGKFTSLATVGLPGNEANPTAHHVTAVYTPTSKDLEVAVTLSSTEDKAWWAVYSVEITELP